MKAWHFIFIGITLSLNQVFAKPWIAGIYGARWENGTESEALETRTPYGFSFGYRLDQHEAQFEYSTYTERTGNKTFSIKRENSNYMFGYRYYLVDVSTFSWYPYATALVGGTQERVETKFIQDVVTKYSKLKPVYGFGAGVWGNAFVKHLKLGSEFRGLTSEDFSPRILLDLSFRLGFEF